MANESQVECEQEELRVRIDESREALVQKIEQLEEKVTETVEMATASVAEATEAVLETVQNATASVSETVDTVTGAVQGTVDNVRESVEGAVGSIKQAFDLNVLVENHPWMAFAGAVGVGFVAERIMHQLDTRPTSAGQPFQGMYYANESSFPESSEYPQVSSPVEMNSSRFDPTVTNGSGHDFSTNGIGAHGSNRFDNNGGSYPTSTAPARKNLASDLFGPEIDKLKSLAIGAGLSGLKELCIKYVPVPLQQPLESLVDDLTNRLGGQPVHGSLFNSPNQ